MQVPFLFSSDPIITVGYDKCSVLIFLYLFRVHRTVTGDKNRNKIEPQYRAIKIRTTGTDTPAGVHFAGPLNVDYVQVFQEAMFRWHSS
jgi:hypothetical protein